MKRVCIIQPVLKGYRVPFFLQLREALAAADVELTLQYGRPWPAEALRGDNETLDLEWVQEVPTILAPGGLMLQPAIRPSWGADLVVLEHANKHLQNYVLTALRHRAFGHLAYWGHGFNRQGNAESPSERLKRRTLHWADWWFAYTAGAAAYVAQQGFPAGRITTVENSVDTTAFREDLGRVTASDRAQLLDHFGWASTDTIALYCGSLYPHKRLDVLVEAAAMVRRRLPTFRLLVVGGGPQAGWMAAQAANNSEWLSFHGPQFGKEKAACFAISHVFLNPGLVGLAILDAFCAGLPMLSTNIPTHSPEIEYLLPGVNGILSAADAPSFADAALQILSDSSRTADLKRGALESSSRFSIETMVHNFSGGVLNCLRM